MNIECILVWKKVVKFLQSALWVKILLLYMERVLFLSYS